MKKRSAKASKKAAPKKPQKPVRLIPPTEAAARDEGPRLLPLDSSSSTPFAHYADLADIALGRKKKD